MDRPPRPKRPVSPPEPGQQMVSDTIAPVDSGRPSDDEADVRSRRGGHETWKRTASAVGGFALGILVNLITPLLTAEAVALIALFVVLTFAVAFLRTRAADTVLALIASVVFFLGACLAAVIGLASTGDGRGVAWVVAVLLAAAAALAPNAAATATAALTVVRRWVETSAGVQQLVLVVILGLGTVMSVLSVVLIIDTGFGGAAVPATAGVSLGLAAWWWHRRRALVGSALAVAVAVTLVVAAIGAITAKDAFTGAVLTGFALSFGGAGGAGLLSRSYLRGWVFVGAAVFAGAGFVAGAFDDYGYSDTTWLLRVLVAALFLVGGIGTLLRLSAVASVTLAAGAAAVALAALSGWNGELGEWPFFLGYGIMGIGSGVAVIAASPVPATARRWLKLLTAHRSAPSPAASRKTEHVL